MVKQLPESGKLLYSTFCIIDELGRGGMGRVLRVKAERSSKGFKAFLASAIAWQEVIQHKNIAQLRQQILQFNKDVQDLLVQEAEFMNIGDDEKGESVRIYIDDVKNEVRQSVEILKKRQQYFVKKRSTQITEVNTQAMIKHLKKVGMNYPDDDIFAMKQVLVDDEEHIARIQDEFKSLKLVQHPNIPSVYDMGRDYYIMEYLEDSVDADEVIADPERKSQYYTNGERIQIVIEAAKAIEHAHVFGVIHRDLKPENIAVDHEGNVKVIDFGLVKSVESEGVTQTGTAVGTPYYMSPEQIRTTRDARSTFDIYSLGATLYNYLTGERPFERARNRFTGKEIEPDSAQEVFLTVCNPSYEPISPCEIAEGIPKVLEDIILKAMAKEIQFRYQSVREFREDLEQYLSLADPNVLQSGSYFGIDAEQVPMTVRRRRSSRSTRKRAVQTPRSMVRKAVIPSLIGVVVLLAVIMVFAAGNGGKEEIIKEEKSKAELAQEFERQIGEMFEYADKWAQEHPDAFKNSVEKYNTVVREGRGTKYELMALDRVKEIIRKWNAEQEKVMAGLDKEAVRFIQKKEYEKAMYVYAEYRGICEEETRKIRGNKTENIRRSREIAFRLKKEQEKFKEIEREIALKREKEKEQKTEEDIVPVYDEAMMRKGLWTDLVQGNSKQEAGWYCSDGYIREGKDNFCFENDVLSVSKECEVSTIRKNIILGDCEFELDYEMGRGYWSLKIMHAFKKKTLTGEHNWIDIKFVNKAKRYKHAKIAVIGTDLMVWLDGIEAKLDWSKGVLVEYGEEKGGERLRFKKMLLPLKGEGTVRIYAAKTDLAISNLRYRLIKGIRGQGAVVSEKEKEREKEGKEEGRVKGQERMVFVQGGDFKEHGLTVDSFFIGRYEITVGEFREFINETGYKTFARTEGKGSFVRYKGKWVYRKDANWKNPYLAQTDDHPVTCIAFLDAAEYCNWRSKKEGLPPCYTMYRQKWRVTCDFEADGYRVPTEIEWEYAARGGKRSKGFEFSGSNNEEDVGWIWGNAGTKTHPVGTKAPNELGLYDMTGNVSEWCWYCSMFDKKYNTKIPPSFNPKTSHVVRGGDYDSGNDLVSVRGRKIRYVKQAHGSRGFRIVRRLKAEDR